MTLDEFKDYIQSSVPEQDCPVAKTLHILSGKWTSRVIYELEKQEHIRFGELKKRLRGVTNTMLSGTLKDLTDKGIVVRTQYNEIPPHVEYSLSDSGRAMLPIYYEMAQWGGQYLE